MIRTALLATALFCATGGARADVRQCLIVGVSDGDTLTARCGTFGAYEQIKVRLSGVDAPERRQPYGTRAKVALSALAFGRMATLDCPKTDRYGRSVCAVWVTPASAPGGPQTVDAGLSMVTLGMAWWYRAYARDQKPKARRQYELAEREAQAERAGIWSDPGAVAPWEWRRARR